MNARITLWDTLGASKSFSGQGRFLDLSWADFAQAMIEEASLIVDKGAGKCFAFARTDRGGSNDDEITHITGCLLDSDRPEDFEKVDSLEAELRRLGIAFVVTRRGRKAHILIPYETEIAPPHGQPKEKEHKALRVRMIQALGAEHGIVFDVAPGKRFGGMIFTHTRRPGSDDVPTVSWSDGTGLDFWALANALGEAPAAPEPAQGGRPPSGAASGAEDFFAAARAAAANGGAASPAIDVDDFEPLSAQQTRARINERVQTENSSDKEMIRKLRQFVLGRSWASTKEQRDTTAQRVASWLASYTEGLGDIDEIMEMAAPSLDAMTAEQSTGFGADAEGLFHAKITRAMGDMRRKLRERDGQQNGIARALGVQSAAKK